MAEPATSMVALVAAGVVFPTLLAAGCQHLVRPGRLAAALRPRGWAPALRLPVALAVAVSETALGLAGVAAMVAGRSRAPVALAAALLFAAFAADAARALWSGTDVPCGCGAAEHPVNQWVVVRTVSYAALSGVAALPGAALVALAALPAVTVLTAAAVIGLLLWLLPRTLAIPRGVALGP